MTSRVRGQRPYRGTALPVFSVDTEAEARSLMILACFLDYHGRYRLRGFADSDGTDVGLLELARDHLRRCYLIMRDKAAGGAGGRDGRKAGLRLHGTTVARDPDYDPDNPERFDWAGRVAQPGVVEIVQKISTEMVVNQRRFNETIDGGEGKHKAILSQDRLSGAVLVPGLQRALNIIAEITEVTEVSGSDPAPGDG